MPRSPRAAANGLNDSGFVTDNIALDGANGTDATFDAAGDTTGNITE